MGSSVRRSVAVLAALSMVFVGLLVSGASAVTTTKPYSADITPACVSANTSTVFTATLRNTTKTQMLGSANITAPTGFTVTGATSPATFVGNTVQLRGLNTAPGGTATATFDATTSATTGTVDWSIIAKQSNDYNGSPGNNLTLDTGNSHLSSYVGTCVLSFLTQPKDAKVGSNVTSVQADPFGTPVQVEVLNGPAGQRVTTSSDSVSLAITSGTGTNGAALTPSTPSANAVNGVASLGFSVDTAGLGYQVTASNPSMTPADSTAFNVADDAVICHPSDHQCTGSATKGNENVTLTAPLSQDGNILLVALGVESLTCANYTPLDVPVVTFSVTGPSYRLVTIRIPATFDSRPASQDLVCYSSDTAGFIDRSGNTVHSVNSGLLPNTGLLPDCKAKTPLSAPCQFPTTVDKATGDHIISFRAPAGSTRGRT